MTIEEKYQELRNMAFDTAIHLKKLCMPREKS